MEKLTTVSNKSGDVATYLYQDGKHTLFTFDYVSNKSYIETLTKNEDTGEWAYISVVSDGSDVVVAVYGAGQARIIISFWENTQKYVDSLDWNGDN